MAKAPTRALHNSIDITRQPHSVTPIRARAGGSPPRLLPQHYPQPTSSSQQAKEVYLAPSPYTQSSRPRLKPRQMRESSPMIKKISSAVALRGIRTRSRGHRNSEAESMSVDRTFGEVYPLRPISKTTSASFIEVQEHQSPRTPPGYFQEARILEMRLSQRLAESKGDDEQKHAIYSDIFHQVITQNKPFSSLLTRLKSTYDSAYHEVSKAKQLQASLVSLETDYQKEKDERKFVYKKLDKLAKENLELSRGLDEREGDCAELKEKLTQIAQIDTRAIAKNETVWRTLVAENQSYQDMFAKMDRDLSLYKKREKRLVKLVLALKNRGYPVDTVYEEDVHNVRPKGEPLPSANSLAGEKHKPADSDSSNSPEVESERQSDADSAMSREKKEAEGHPNPHPVTDKPDSKPCPVPLLVLPPGQENGFHQEFLAKMDEFSESWRKQIQSDHRAAVP